MSANYLPIKFCTQCGHATEYTVPDGDDKLRAVCPACGFIHYENPKIVNACIVECNGRILLGKRAIAPRRGYWGIPAGFMELGETCREGALRECKEELCANVGKVELFGVYNVVPKDQVHVIFRGELLGEKFGACHETLEARLFRENEIPWDKLAFPVVVHALKRYFQERAFGQFSVREENVLEDFKEPLIES